MRRDRPLDSRSSSLIYVEVRYIGSLPGGGHVSSRRFVVYSDSRSSSLG